MPLPVTVVGVPGLTDRLGRFAAPSVAPAAAGARVVVVGGPVAERVARAVEAVEGGAHAFLLWPPAETARGAGVLADRAEEAGVEVGVARPLGASAALAGVPAGWAARLVTLALVARLDGPLARSGWPTLLAGALDVCTSLTAARAVSRLDAVAERDRGALRAVALAARFDNGAHAQATVRFADHAAADEVVLYASRPGSCVEARSLAGPLCVEAEGRTAPVAPPASDPEAAEVAAFVAAVAAGRPAPYALDDALAALRLAEEAQERLR